MGASVMTVQERAFAGIAYSQLPVSDWGGYSDAPVARFEHTAFSMAEGWKRARERLLTLWNLEPDWDDAGASAPDKSILSGAIRMSEAQRSGWLSEQTEAKMADGRPTRLLPPPSRISPSQDGTILFEWQAPGFYFEIEALTPNTGECMLIDGESKAEHFPFRW